MPAEVTSMVSGYGVVPWHKLGTVLEGEVPFDRALELGGIDWEVEMVPVLAQWSKNGDVVTSPNHRACVRKTDHKVYGVMSPTFQPVQNADGLDFIRVLLEGGDVKIETVGALNDGAQTFICVRLDKDLTIGGELHVPYLAGFNGHDGSLAFGAAAGPVRVVCRNTVNFMLQQAASTWRMRHTTNVEKKISEAREALHLVWTYYDEFAKEVEALMAQPTTEKAFERLLTTKVFPDAPERAEARMSRDGHTTVSQQSVLDNRDGVRMFWMREHDVHGRTAWAALNAFNSWELWSKPVGGKTAAAKETNRATRQAMTVLRGRPGKVTRDVHAALIAAR